MTIPEKIGLWLQGKKTIFAAVLTLLLTVLGFWYGKLTVAQALQLLSFASVAVGLGAKLQRYLPQILIALQGLATALADYKAGQIGQAVQAVEGTAVQLIPDAGVASVVGQAISEANWPPLDATTGLHITGSEAHVATAVAALAGAARA